MRPPLRDAHLHLAEYGASLNVLDLSGCSSLAECLERMREECQRTRDPAWVIGMAARPSAWPEGRFPYASELDEACEARPAVVRCFDHHSGAGSTAALVAAGLTDGARSPTAEPGVVADMDVRDARATGAVRESAYAMLLAAAPQRSDEETERHILRAQAALAGYGIVEAHEMWAVPQVVRALRALEDRGELALRVVLHAVPDHFAEVRRLAHERASEHIEFGGLKLFIDGTLSGRTAHMLDPFREGLPEAPCGTPLVPEVELRRHLAQAGAEGHDVAVHAIGDGAVRRLLNAEEATDRATGTLRIEHAQFVHPDDVARLPRLAGDRARVIVSPQPMHLLVDIEAIERFVPHAADRAFPMASLVRTYTDAGLDPSAHVCLGSDAPVVRPDPADNVRAAVHRSRLSEPDRVIAAHEAIDEATALSLCAAR